MTRVPNITQHRHLVAMVQRNESNLSRSQLDLASGIRIRRPSDDVRGAAQALRGQAGRRRLEGLRAATEQVGHTATATESAMAEVQDLLMQARLVATEAGDASADSPEARAALAEQLNQLLEEMAEVANRRALGPGHLFGGNVTTPAPYVVTRDADGDITDVVATAGIEVPVTRMVGEAATEFPITGPGVFTDGGDIFDTLIDLRDAILADDDAEVLLAQGELDGEESHVAAEVGRLGGFLQRVQRTVENLSSREIGYEEIRSEAMDTDVAASVMELTNAETFYQAALQMSARVSQLNLMSFL
jgi:flagellar hook-associated protein 3 FlgL